MKENRIEKKKIDINKIVIKIVASIMAILMVLGICLTFIYYGIRML